MEVRSSMNSSGKRPAYRRGSLRCHVILCGMFFVLASMAISGLRAGEPLRLTQDGSLKFSPVFAGTEEEIVYVRLQKPELFRLMRLKLVDGATEGVNPETARSEFEPTFSSDGRHFAFMRTF